MIKVFTTNKNGKIELTADELKKILDEAYWEGYRASSGLTWTYNTPNWTPYVSTTIGQNTTIALNADEIKGGVLNSVGVADNPNYEG